MMADSAPVPATTISPVDGAAAQAIQRRSIVRDLDPALKAAVVISMLGEAAARPIVERLDDAALAKVASAIDKVSLMPREELAEIVVDFISQMRSDAKLFPGGKGELKGLLSSLAAARVSGSDADGVAAVTMLETDVQNAPEEETGDVWARLARRKPPLIAEYLNKLTPNLIAIVLGKLDVALTSEILVHIDESKVERVLGQMVQGDIQDEDIQVIVSQMIEVEFLATEATQEDEDSSHLSSIGELLTLIPADKRDRMVAFLKDKHEGKLDGIQKSLFTLEGLPERLPRNAVSVVMREMDPQDGVRFISTLTGKYDAVANFILENISSRQAEQIKEDVQEITPLEPAEAEDIQREFLTLIMSLKRSGKIETV